jgi:hypothetical protein
MRGISQLPALGRDKEVIPKMSLKNLLPKPAMIVALVALIAAVGGSAYAAAKIDTQDIANDAITARQVENDSLKGKDFKDGGLKGKDLKDDKLTGKQINEDKLVGVKARWLLLNEQGQIEDQSGGFTVIDAYDTNANAYIDTGESLVGKGMTATIAIQNQVDVDGGAGADPSFGGEVSVTRCQIPNVVECAPDGAKNDNALVVSPRESDGTAAATASPGTGPGTSTKRVYVTITEGQTATP